eukprot:TRINITY_DN22563_c0_g1_i1.p1 TRINITY_DN22563_c0_g1~~TRINITY_DN22563_c0_g1_i1.p1  ORF type:complete len:962 (+),score=283.35 TRINITY_DN22563_c0_g1_i1:151-3036(+)
MASFVADDPSAVQEPGVVLGVLRSAHVVYELEELETVIGRGEDCDLLLEGPGVSRTHARLLFYEGGGFCPQLVDLGSAHGTYVDTQRLQPNVPVDLTDGCYVKFGARSKTAYIFELPPSALLQPPVTPPPVASAADCAAGGGAAAVRRRRPRSAGGDPGGHDGVGHDPRDLPPAGWRPPQTPSKKHAAERADAAAAAAAPVREAPDRRVQTPPRRRHSAGPAPGRDAGVARTMSPPRGGARGERQSHHDKKNEAALSRAARAVPPPLPFVPTPAAGRRGGDPQQQQQQQPPFPPPPLFPSQGPQAGQAAAAAAGAAYARAPVGDESSFMAGGPMSVVQPVLPPTVQILPVPVPYPIMQVAGYPPPAPATRLQDAACGSSDAANSDGGRELLIERLRHLEEKFDGIAARKEHYAVPEAATPTYAPRYASGDLLDRRGASSSVDVADATAVACSALALQRAADHLSRLPRKMWKIREKLSGVHGAEAPDWASRGSFHLDDDQVWERMSDFSQQLFCACDRLEALLGKCDLDVAAVRDSMTESSRRAQQAAEDARAAEEAEARRAEAEAEDGRRRAAEGAAAKAAAEAEASEAVAAQEAARLEERCRTLQEQIREVSAKRTALEEELARQARPESTAPEPEEEESLLWDTAGPADPGLEAALEWSLMELRRHLSLYAGAGAGFDEEGKEGGSHDDGQSCGDAAAAGLDVWTTVSSLRSLTEARQPPDSQETFVVLQALVSASRRLSDHTDGGASRPRRRWSLLAEEMERLRLESRLQKERAEKVKLELAGEASEFEAEASALRRDVAKAAELGSRDKQQGARVACATLLRELEAQEAARTAAAERVSAAEKSLEDVKRRYQDAKAAVAIATGAHGAAEEAADAAEEERRGAAAVRHDQLRRSNDFLRAQVERAEAWCDELRQQLAGPKEESVEELPKEGSAAPAQEPSETAAAVTVTPASADGA